MNFDPRTTHPGPRCNPGACNSPAKHLLLTFDTTLPSAVHPAHRGVSDNRSRSILPGKLRLVLIGRLVQARLPNHEEPSVKRFVDMLTSTHTPDPAPVFGGSEPREIQHSPERGQWHRHQESGSCEEVLSSCLVESPGRLLGPTVPP